MVESTNYWAATCKYYLWNFLCFGGEVLGSIPCDAFAFDDSTDSFGCINIESLTQHVCLFHGKLDATVSRSDLMILVALQCAISEVH